MEISKQVIKECINGKRTAQHALYSHYAPKMLGLCYRYTKSLEDAEDVLQDGFVKVFTKIEQYRGESSLGAWIRRIMVNTAISYLRSHNRYKKELDIETIAVHPISDENPEVHLHAKDLAEFIRQLPTAYQLIFNLVAIEGYEHTEVASLLQMNINTVRSQYSRARAMMIQQIKLQEQIITNTYAK